MNLQDTACLIRCHHEQALSGAKGAINHAKAAGILLLQMKDSMPCIQFIEWLSRNCGFSEQQAQNYLAVAQGKQVPIRRLGGGTDLDSDLAGLVKTSDGIWRGDRWEPVPGFMYLFKDETGSYFVTPTPDGGTHVCKHYSGSRMSSEGFHWRYTIFAVNTDPDLTTQFYVGTRYAPFLRSGIQEILRSYGLKSIKESLIYGTVDENPSPRPICEPSPENWYWDAPITDDGLHDQLKRLGLVTEHGIPITC